jgi:hypothetical protein
MAKGTPKVASKAAANRIVAKAVKQRSAWVRQAGLLPGEPM